MRHLTAKISIICMLIMMLASLCGCGQSTVMSTPSSNDPEFIFLWDGGTMGHVDITCDEVIQEGDQTYAVITFTRKNSHSKSQFSKVKSLGVEVEGDNTFKIPVNVNQNTEIEAFTTAMSQGHWISYTIYVGTDQTSMTITDQVDQFDETIPQIVGLTPKSERQLEHAKYIKVFEYEDGYHLIEVDAGTDTAREGKSYEELDQLLDAAEELHAKYKNQIIKYLVVPEGHEVPVGLSNYVVIIHLPIQQVYDASGCYDDWDYKTMIKDHVDFILEPSTILPKDKEQLKENWALYSKLVSRAEQMEIPVFIDRSAEESSEAAATEWDMVFESVLGF